MTDYDDRIAELKRAYFEWYRKVPNADLGTVCTLLDSTIALASELAEKLSASYQARESVEEDASEYATELKVERQTHLDTKRVLLEMTARHAETKRELDKLLVDYAHAVAHNFHESDRQLNAEYQARLRLSAELSEAKWELEQERKTVELLRAALPPPVSPVAAEEHVDFRECSSGDGGTHVFLSEARDARCELCGMLYERAFPEEPGAEERCDAVVGQFSLPCVLPKGHDGIHMGNAFQLPNRKAKAGDK